MARIDEETLIFVAHRPIKQFDGSSIDSVAHRIPNP